MKLRALGCLAASESLMIEQAKLKHFTVSGLAAKELFPRETRIPLALVFTSLKSVTKFPTSASISWMIKEQAWKCFPT